MALFRDKLPLRPILAMERKNIVDMFLPVSRKLPTYSSFFISFALGAKNKNQMMIMTEGMVQGLVVIIPQILSIGGNP